MKFKSLILFSFILLSWWTAANAQSGDDPHFGPVILTDDQEKYALGLHLEILEDPRGELTIEDVTSPEYADRFRPSETDVPNYGFTESVYWVRLPLRSESEMTTRWLLEIGFANMQFVDLYVPLDNGKDFAERQTGTARPAASRDIQNPRIIFDLQIPSKSEQTFYLRFQNGASMTLDLVLWEPLAFVNHVQVDHLKHGIFFGILFAMLAYNLFLLFSLREKSYLFLALFIANFIFFELTYLGYLEVYIAPELYYLKSDYQPITFALISVWTVLFSNYFLEAKSSLPRIHKVNIAILGVWGILVLLIPFTSYHFLATLMVPWALPSLAVVLVAGIVSWRVGNRAARFFLFAWLGFLVTILITLLVRLGIVPSTGFFENAYLFGIMWMVVSWSIALAERINLLKAETEEINRSLQSSEDRLSQTLEAMPVGVVVYGTDQKPTFINKRTAEILSNPERGLGPHPSFERSLGETMSYYSFRIVSSDQAYPLEQFPVYRALQGEPSTADDVEADLVDWRVPLEVWASPVFDDAGNVESAVIAFQDITLRRQQEAELEQYRKHLEQLVQVRTDELGAINERLVKEVAERELLELFLYKRIQWMSAFSLIRQKIKGASGLPEAFEKLSERILQLLDAGSVFLFRLDGRDEQSEFICRLQHEGTVPDAESILVSFQKGSPLRREIELGQTIIYSADQLASLPAPFQRCLQEDSMHSLMLVPMTDGTTVAGVLGMVLPQHVQSLTSFQTDLVPKMALDLLSLTQYAAYLDQARALVATEERNRLARDLHDSVTQVLFSASLVAEVLPNIWRRDPDRAMQSLEELRRLTRGALAEMRTMLLELRPAAVIKSPLHELLAQLTEAITSRVQLPFRLFIERTPPLPEDVHTVFYRIAQEALNNVAKHAQASQVTLNLDARPLTRQQAGEQEVEVMLVIEDDGAGFSPENEQVEHLGLGIMRERAANIQAALTIESETGKGTRVILIWCGPVETNHE